MLWWSSQNQSRIQCLSNSQGWEACRPVAFRYDPAGHETDNDEGAQTDDDVAPAVGSKQ